MNYGIRVHDMRHERARAKRWERVAEEIAQGAGEISLKSLPEEEGVEVIEIIEGILENRNQIHVVNVPNKGAIENLPEDAIVEVSCVVGRYGIKPIHVGRLPDPIASTLSNHVTVQELTVKAALTGDRHTALQAFLQDPQVSSKLTPEETKKLLEELINEHIRYLPKFSDPTR